MHLNASQLRARLSKPFVCLFRCVRCSATCVLFIKQVQQPGNAECLSSEPHVPWHKSRFSLLKRIAQMKGGEMCLIRHSSFMPFAVAILCGSLSASEQQAWCRYVKAYHVNCIEILMAEADRGQLLKQLIRKQSEVCYLLRVHQRIDTLGGYNI